MIIWEIIGIILVILIIIGIVSSRKSVKEATDRCLQLFTEIDIKYERIVDKSIALSLLKENEVNFDMQAFIDESMIVIKPEIEALIAIINSSNVSSLTIEYSSIFFKNAVSVAEALIKKSYKAKNKNISETDEEAFYEAFKDAIRSDLTKRKIDLKIGNI